MLKHRKKRQLSYARVIVLGILTVILLGTLLLMLPMSTKSGEPTTLNRAFFTSTSAVCVTGLVLEDTYLYWSVFGQVVILVLIQIGGMGFMSIVTLLSLFMGRHIGLRERRLIMESSGIMQLGGMMPLFRRIAGGTFIIEGVGALLLSFRFCPELGFVEGVYNAVFHSVSAFCNAGFDLMGRHAPFSSLTHYATDAYVNIVIMLLIVLGGIGYLVWDDVITNKFRFKRYRLHSKIVLVTTAILILGGAVLFFALEYGHSLAGYTLPEKILLSFFQSITPRTAGFSTLDSASFSEAGALVTIVLMFIGGSSGSTAGGVKTGTIAVLVLGMLASAKRKKDIVIFRRRIDGDSIRQASSIAFIYIMAIFAASLLLCAFENASLKAVLFETASAMGTVGSSMALTPSLSIISQIVIVLLMFGGRAGGLTLALVLAERNKVVPSEHPTEKILIG